MKSLWIPDAVAEAIGAELSEQTSWIARNPVSDRERVAALPQRLHRGEREAIVLAAELKASLLADDREARKEAARRGIEYLGSLRVLKRAKEIGLVSRIRPALDDLISRGTYIGKDLYWEFLCQVGETE